MPSPLHLIKIKSVHHSYIFKNSRLRQTLTAPILGTVKGNTPAFPTTCDSKGAIMLDATTISSTIDTVNRAAAALGVSPNGDDGLTFTRREFNAETKGAHIF